MTFKVSIGIEFIDSLSFKPFDINEDWLPQSNNARTVVASLVRGLHTSIKAVERLSACTPD